MSNDDAFEVVLERPDSYTSWGFRLHGGVGAPQPLNVQLVYDGTPADSVGLEIGDRILKIGGQDSTNLSNFDAKRLVSQQGDRLCLTVRRRRGAVSLPTRRPPANDSVVATAQPARAKDDDPPPTPPSPATAIGSAWSDKGSRAGMPTYQRHIIDHGGKPEPAEPVLRQPWRPPPGISEAPKRHSVPVQRSGPQTVLPPAPALNVPSAEAQVSEETIMLQRPKAGAATTFQMQVATGGEAHDNGDRTALPAYQRDIVMRPGGSPTFPRRANVIEATQEPSHVNLSPRSDQAQKPLSYEEFTPVPAVAQPTDFAAKETWYPQDKPTVYMQEFTPVPTVAQPTDFGVKGPWNPQPSQEMPTVSKEEFTPIATIAQPTDFTAKGVWNQRPSHETASVPKEESTPIPTITQPTDYDARERWKPPPSETAPVSNEEFVPISAIAQPTDFSKDNDMYRYNPASVLEPTATESRSSPQRFEPQADYPRPASTFTRQVQPSPNSPSWNSTPINYNIDYSQMPKSPAYQSGSPASTLTRQAQQSGSGSPSWNAPGRRFEDDDDAQMASLPAYQRDLLNRGSPASTLTRRMLPSGPANPSWNSPRQQDFNEEASAQMATLPAYQRDLLNRGSPASTLTRRVQSPVYGSPSHHSPVQGRRFNGEENTQSSLPPYQRDLLNRGSPASTLTRQVQPTGPGSPSWNSPSHQSGLFNEDENTQMNSLPSYQRDLLNRGSPASTLTRQATPAKVSDQQYTSSRHSEVPADTGSSLPSYQRDLMNRLAATSLEPIPKRAQDYQEQSWYDPDRRFSVPAYQRDLLSMGSHFDKSGASNGRRPDVPSEAPGPNDSPPSRPMLAKSYTPSEIVSCDLCGKDVRGPFVRILSKYRVHPECVRCCVCGTCLRDTTRVMMEDKLFCEPHALEFAKPPGEDMVPVIYYPDA